MGAHGNDAPRPDVQRQAHVVVMLPDPAAARTLLAGEQARPAALGQVVLRHALVVEDGRHQQAVAQHVLGAQAHAGTLLRELEGHHAHHGHAGFVGQHGLAVEVWHEAVLQAGEAPQHIHRLLVIGPGHPVAAGAMEPGVAGQKAEGAPALVHIRRGGVLEAADVVAPEPEARAGQRQAAPQGLLHGHIAAPAVAAPVDGELLPAHRGRPGKQHRFLLAALAHDGVVDGLVVQVGVVVVHHFRICAIVIHAVGGDALAEVGLEAVHAHVKQPLQLGGVPPAGLRVGEVHQRHAGLPHVPLPHIAVGPLEEVALLRALGEQMGFLPHIAVDPHTDLEALALQPLQHTLRVGEHRRIPQEVAPVEGPHPEAVEVEHRQGNSPLDHSVHKAVDGRLVIIGGEGGGQPQSEGPRRRQGGMAGDVRVAAQGVLHGGAADEEEIQHLPLDGEGHL